MNYIKKCIIVLMVFILTSCSVPELNYNVELTNTDYNNIISQLLKKTSKQMFPYIDKDEILIVSNFSDNVTLKSNTKLSFILTDILKNQLVSDYSYTIREIELSKIFKFGKNGFKILTRNLNLVKNDSISQTRYAVVGTYTFTKNQMILFLKLINIHNGNLLASSSYTTDLTQELYDANNITIDKLKEDKNKMPNIYPPVVL